MRTLALSLAMAIAARGLAQAPTVGSTGSGTSSVVGAVAERVPPRASANDPVVRLSITPPPKRQGEITLREVFQLVREATGVPVQGFWSGKSPGAGLDPDATVRIDVPVGNCADLLDLALDQVAGTGEPCTWQVTKFGVEAGPCSALWRPSALQVRVYDVSDLLLRAPSFRSTGIPQPGGSSGSSGGGGAGGGGTSGGAGSGGNSGGNSGGGSGGGANGSTNVEDTSVHPRKAARREDLVGIIQRNVVPQAWDVNGGPCTITPHDATLIVRAPEFVHRLIESPTVDRRLPDSPAQRAGSTKSAP